MACREPARFGWPALVGMLLVNALTSALADVYIIVSMGSVRCETLLARW